MTNEERYNLYVQACKRTRSYPVAFDIWVARQETKTTDFRKGQKKEIGFDLDENYTGNKNRKFSTSEGEQLQ